MAQATTGHFGSPVRFGNLMVVVDTISPDRRSENMRRIRSKGMEPELHVRRLLFQMGYRYRLHRRKLPGHPDIIFPARKKVIFVHGCFWHQHSDPACKITRLPKSNKDYWLPKLRRNKERDEQNQMLLSKLGWQALVIWECETKDAASLSRILERFVDAPPVRSTT